MTHALNVRAGVEAEAMPTSMHASFQPSGHIGIVDGKTDIHGEVKHWKTSTDPAPPRGVLSDDCDRDSWMAANTAPTDALVSHLNVA